MQHRLAAGVARHISNHGLTRGECTTASAQDWTDHEKPLRGPAPTDRQLDD
jgi:hypothetical protein